MWQASEQNGERVTGERQSCVHPSRGGGRVLARSQVGERGHGVLALEGGVNEAGTGKQVGTGFQFVLSRIRASCSRRVFASALVAANERHFANDFCLCIRGSESEGGREGGTERERERGGERVNGA